MTLSASVAGVLLQPLEARDKAQLLVERITKAVAEGLLKPGDQLPSEREMAEELAVSRSIVREALSALGATGLIARRVGRGNFIADVPDPMVLRARALGFLDSSPDPYEVWLAREALEPALSELIVGNASIEDFGKLALALNALTQACETQDWGGYFSADQQFHASLVACTHNTCVMQAMERLLSEMQAPLWKTLKQSYFLENPMNAETSVEDHKLILAAVLERDGPELGASLKKHFQDLRSVLEYGGAQPDSVQRDDAGRGTRASPA